ncbi:MAG: flagellar hook-length control protein FliK [Methylophilus sp.]|jgi:hypothetical protein
MLTGKPDLASQQVNAISRVLPVVAIAGIASPEQELSNKLSQLVQGREYQAKVLSKLSDTTFLVKITGNQQQEIALKMELGSQAKVGQMLQLEYLHNSPTLTFLLKQDALGPGATKVSFSDMATQLNQYLQQAEAEGVPKRFEASSIVTQLPTNPQMVAQDLKQAVSKTGLFYESHLQELQLGQMTLKQIKQEPQNHSGFNPAVTTFQQLAILENQRLAWHGEIWPGQNMTWDVYQQQESKQSSEQWDDRDVSTPIASELSIDFPNLGKVTAKISIVDGHLRVHLEGEQAPTIQNMQKQKHQLAEAFINSGQKLDALTVTRHESSAV